MRALFDVLPAVCVLLQLLDKLRGLAQRVACGCQLRAVRIWVRFPAHASTERYHQLQL